eukprot:Colp12_sorted_trinity150504_noHs@15857
MQLALPSKVSVEPVLRVGAGEQLATLGPDQQGAGHQERCVEDRQRVRVARQGDVSESRSVHHEDRQAGGDEHTTVGHGVGEEAVLEDGHRARAREEQVRALARHDRQEPRGLHRPQDLFLLVLVVRAARAVGGDEDVVSVGGGEVLGGVGEELLSGHTVQVESQEVGQPAAASNDRAGLSVGVEKQREGSQLVGLHVARRHLHDQTLGLLIGERGGGNQLRQQVDAQRQQTAHGLRATHKRPAEDGDHFRGQVRQRVGDGLLQVHEQSAALLDADHDRGEVVVQQHHVGGLLGHVAAVQTHRDADGGLLQRGRVVHSVAGHRGHVAGLGELLHDDQLLLGGCAREHDLGLGHQHGPVVLRHVGDLSSVHHHGADVLLGHALRVDVALFRQHVARGLRDQADLARDGGGRQRVVAGHHHHLHSGGVALLDGLGDLVSRRVLQRDQAHEDQVLDGVLRVRLLADHVRAQRLLVLGVGGQLLLHGLVHGAHRETQHSLAVASEVLVGRGVDALELLVDGLDAAVGVHERATLAQKHVGGALQEQHLLARALHLVDGHLPLERRVEGDLVHLGVGASEVLDLLAEARVHGGRHEAVQTQLGGVSVGHQLVRALLRLRCT